MTASPSIICSWRRWLLACGAMLGLVGCGDLQTEYGDRQMGSVNGVRVLHARVGDYFPSREIPRLGKRVGDADVMIHFALAYGLPDPDGMDWIDDWLHEAADRQAVIILRDGNMAPWLCRRWADEILAEMPNADDQRRAILQRQVDRLMERAHEEDEPDSFFVGTEQSSPHFTFTPKPSARAGRLRGLIDARAPEFLESRSTLSAPEGVQARTLVAIDDAAYAIAIPIGQSRLVVLAHAVPLLDAAQVDPVSRRLLTALLDDLEGNGGSQAVWVRRLSIGGETDPPPPNILALLFGRPPFNGIVIHLLVLTLAFLAMKALWIGRTEAVTTDHLQRFDRHVEAFAWHLRRAKGSQRILEALAAILRRPLPPRGGDAFATARALYRDPVHVETEDPVRDPKGSDDDRRKPDA